MLSRISISTRIWLLPCLLIVIFSVVYIQDTFQLKENLLSAKKDRLQGLVTTAHAILGDYHQRSQNNEMSETEARQAASRVISQLRYDKNQYFWINDLQPQIIMHPIKPSLNGKDASAIKDKQGKLLFMAFVDVVNNNGEGFVDYFWAAPNGSEEQLPKLSYVKGFKAWNWMVGSGIYVNDIDEQFTTILTQRLIFLGITLVVFIVLCLLISRSIIRPLHQTTEAMKDISQGEGNLTVRLPVNTSDELGILAATFNTFVERIHQTVIQVRTYGDELVTASDSLANITDQTNSSIATHQEETHKIVEAVREMNHTVQEVAGNASEAANSVSAVRNQAMEGQSVVKASISATHNLAQSVDQAVTSIQTLETDVENIGGILDVIRSIADQTNLLALNAAIEAARAGEQGRGFAVVADEVRVLAQRTQESTEEIQSMIEQLQNGAHNTVTVIQTGRSQAEVSVQQSEQAGATLNSITQDILSVADMNTQIASATEQQSSTVNMISHNVNNMHHAFGQTTESSQQVTQSSEQLNQLANNIHKLLGQFKI
ncbi:methyl-accepting chemotaxis protein [Aliamphritea ceti]|uniref:methyl-accepting chemotaxis protein n=1 Tax=Aliamphritea ceti TaxID=1524258 RepID=UPI0021C34C88|nr:methyl-accepting chemotaxis protein [Aliamphritea ceti]